MTDCDWMQPLIFRLAEGETTPDEAIRVARHLPACTACRIQLARERRLAAMLDQGLSDPLHVGEDFVRQVMEHLPPNPPLTRQSARRGLRLAGLRGTSGS